jgi:hypothetical protein
MHSRVPLPLACLLSLLAAGCAEPGPYPSLALRPAEAVYAAGDPERVPVATPDDPTIVGQIEMLVQSGRAGNAAFEEALARAQPLVARAGAPASDSWIEAHQALSRAQSARQQTLRAVADLDAYAISRARDGLVSPTDTERLQAGTAALQAIADLQQDQLAALQAQLRL